MVLATAVQRRLGKWKNGSNRSNSSKRQSGARRDCDQLLREPLRSACSRLGSFFCAVPRRRVRLERAEKVTGDRCYFVNGSKKCSFVGFDGLLKPLTFLTNCNEAARISSSVTGGWKLKSVLMLLHIIVYLDVSEPGVPAG